MFHLLSVYTFCLFFSFIVNESKYHSSNVKYSFLEVGKQKTINIDNSEIIIFQFNSTLQINNFYCHSNLGDPLMYGYYTRNITEFSITETE